MAFGARVSLLRFPASVDTKTCIWRNEDRVTSPQTVRVVRDLLDVGGALEMHTTTYGARKAAYGNTVRLNGEKADLIETKYGWDARQAFSEQVARNFKVHVERYYCGSKEHMNDFAGKLHSFAQDYWYLPVAPTLADWCAYVAEGDVQNTILYSFYSLLDVVPGGSSVFRIGENFTVKAGSKMAMGFGLNEAKEDLLTAARRMDVQGKKDLKKNLADAGVEKPSGYSSAAHHIVPKGVKTNDDAAEARKIIEEWGIDVNNAANGVYLPTEKGINAGSYHPSLHTKDYYKMVYDKVSAAGSRDKVLEVLEEIRRELQAGIY